MNHTTMMQSTGIWATELHFIGKEKRKVVLHNGAHFHQDVCVDDGKPILRARVYEGAY